MIRLHCILYFTLTSVLFYLPILADAQTFENIDAQSNELATTANANTIQPGELKVTRYPLDNASRAENHYRKAIIFAQQGQNEMAETLLHQALAQQGDHLPARELLVSMMINRHALQDAVAVLINGIALTPRHVKLPLWLAQLYMKLESPESALNVLEQNAARFKQQSIYLGALASLYQQLGRHTEAHQYFLQATKLTPLDGRWWVGLAISAEVLEDWPGAHTAYRHVLDFSFPDRLLRQFAEQRLTVLSTRL